MGAGGAGGAGGGAGRYVYPSPCKAEEAAYAAAMQAHGMGYGGGMDFGHGRYLGSVQAASRHYPSVVAGRGVDGEGAGAGAGGDSRDAQVGCGGAGSSWAQ